MHATDMWNVLQSDYWIYSDTAISLIIGLPFISHCVKLCEIKITLQNVTLPMFGWMLFMFGLAWHTMCCLKKKGYDIGFFLIKNGFFFVHYTFLEYIQSFVELPSLSGRCVTHPPALLYIAKVCKSCLNYDNESRRRQKIAKSLAYK